MSNRTEQRSMRIGQMAERLGINTRTIRYYETIGLLPEPRRRPSGYRIYSDADLERVAFVRRAQEFGLRLDEIGEVLALRDRGERPCEYVLGAVHRELGHLDRRIADLQAMRAQLSGLLARADVLAAADGGGYCELLEHREDEER